MGNKLVLTLGLIFVLLGVVGVAINVERVEASGTIYIRANGLVEGTNKITNAGNITYTFTDNITDSIVVERSNIIIDGKGYTVQGSGSGDGFYWIGINNVTIKNINIKNFAIGVEAESSNDSAVSGITVTNSSIGIYLCRSNNSAVSGNTIINSNGVYVVASNNSAVSENIITNSTYYGVVLWGGKNSAVYGNTVTNCSTGINLHGVASNNKIFHNNFIDNSHQAYIATDSLDNVWDDGYPSGGNYWSNYTGVDANMDGIGDSSYQIDSMNIDHYPLMGAFSDFPAILEEETYHVTTVCNSTISAFEFDQVNRIIRFNVTGEEGIGFCRVCIPHALVDPNNILVIIDNGQTPVLYSNYTLYDNSTHRWIYFAYEHSTHEIDIIPEFPSFLILPLFMIATLLAVIVYKRKHAI